MCMFVPHNVYTQNREHTVTQCRHCHYTGSTNLFLVFTVDCFFNFFFNRKSTEVFGYYNQLQVKSLTIIYLQTYHIITNTVYLFW